MVPQGRCRGLLAFKAMRHLLLQQCEFEVDSLVPPRQLRDRVFGQAAASPGQPPEETLALISAELGLSRVELTRSLYADIPAERRLRLSDDLVSPMELIERYNLRLAQGILRRAHHLDVQLRDHVKAVLRAARLNGLLCYAEAGRGDDGTLLELSGPLSILRQTTKYGRQLANWLPAVIGTSGWDLSARCTLRGHDVLWVASHNDGIGGGHAPSRRFDSKLEARFFRDLKRLAPQWQVLREADPVHLGQSIICADFTLLDPQQNLRIPVEIIGFWTPQYLQQKIETLSKMPAGLPWVFCVDEGLEPLALQALRDALVNVVGAPMVFPFRKRIDVAAFLTFLARGRRALPQRRLGCSAEVGA